ncbi:hypothetical protein AMS68_002632 [Peltaster fructicola]|uniref:Mid2 domain-containing protein n=1 Tax=Peltaster fructicola TaxID=286661 RepID=A0A6H0XR51_9PEZI|nr:hypothetical protein AMS68_002632 [Peltaster fructicola]
MSTGAIPNNARGEASNPTPYLTPIAATTTNLVTQTIQNALTTYTTVVNIAQSPVSSDNQSGNSALSGAQIGGIVGGLLGAFVLLGLLFWLLRRTHGGSDHSDTISEYGLGRSGPGPGPMSGQFTTLHAGTGEEVPVTLRGKPIPGVILDMRTGTAGGWRRPRRSGHDRDAGVNRDPQFDESSTTDDQSMAGHYVYESVRYPQPARVRRFVRLET